LRVALMLSAVWLLPVFPTTSILSLNFAFV